jgi:Mrp family chromosome partitioning ATPase/capsular polysaccharide biosynthesis protein
MNQTTDASAILAPLWRRKWLILAVGIVVALGTFFYYRRERATYLATTQIYLGAGAEEQAQISGGRTTSVKKSAALEPTAQATLIESAIIREPVRRALHKEHKSRTVHLALAGKTKAKASEKSEFIVLSSEAHSARAAALLANLTAQTYVNRENGKYTREIEAAITLTRRQLRRIETTEEVRSIEASKSSGKGSAKSSAPSTSLLLQAANLSSKINQLEGELSIMSVRQLNPAKAKTATVLSSSPKKNAIFGFAVGLLLASFAVYALAKFDTRLRSLPEIEAAFGLEILASLRAVAHPIVFKDGQPTPSALLREPLQRLHTTLQVGRRQDQELQSRPRTIMFLSADAGDGQSTVVADLALIQRDAGAAAAIVEADLHRPVLARLLGVSDRPGLAEVVEGRLALREAIQDVGAAPVSAPAPAPVASHGEELAAGRVATVVQAPATGSASVLVAGPTVANPPALLASAPMAEMLHAVAQEFDYVLIDAPSPLEVSDVIPLLSLADAIIIVARVGQTRELSARRLVQLLARTPSAPVLGVVANGVSQRDIKAYGFSAYRGKTLLSRLLGR